MQRLVDENVALDAVDALAGLALERGALADQRTLTAVAVALLNQTISQRYLASHRTTGFASIFLLLMRRIN